MDRRDIKSVRRILSIKRSRAEMETARIEAGLVAGRALRDRLETSELAYEYLDMTVGYVLRTIGILDRGLAVLSQQKEQALLKLTHVDGVLRHVDSLAKAAAQDSERADTERLIEDYISSRFGKK